MRGDGGMVVGVPSVKGDAGYRWLNPPGFFELADCPEWLLALCRKPEPKPRIDTGSHFATGNSEAGADEVREALTWVDADLPYGDWVQS